MEKTSLNLKHLKTLELYNLPKLGYLDIRGLLAQLHYLENFDFEVSKLQKLYAFYLHKLSFI